MQKVRLVSEFLKTISPTMTKDEICKRTLTFLFEKLKLSCRLNDLKLGDENGKKELIKFAENYLVVYLRRKTNLEFIRIMLEIAERYIVYSELFQSSKKFATTDRLTGLFNKAYFMGILKNMKARKENFWLAMLDLDNFKKFNDSFGHQQGDILLKQVGEIIRTELKHGEFACRYGGEEFCIVLKSNAYARTEALRKRIAIINGIVTASIGLTKSSNESFYELIKRADKLMYKAKKSGKNKIIYDRYEGSILSKLINLFSS